MSETAKKAREALKAKARRMASGETGKVDASGYTTPGAMNAGVKTGMRPVSPRAFKRGGKVVSCEGGMSAPRSDKAPRKRASGGSTPSDKASYEPAMAKGNQENARAAYEEGRTPKKAGGKVEYPVVDRYINRDLKKANDLRDGKKHVGGMKSGGRAKKQGGGYMPVENDAVSPAMRDQIERGPRTPAPIAKPMPAKPTAPEMSEADRRGMTADEAREFMGSQRYKSGGRTKKMMGGSMVDPRKAMQFSGNPAIPGMKKGGAAKKFEGSAKDEAQDKKLAKKHGMSMKRWEASKMDTKHDTQKSMKGLKSGGRTKRMDGGAMLGGILPSLAKEDPKKILGLAAGNMKRGGRAERKSGGRVKPKTNINIVIQAGQKPDQMGMQPPPQPPGMPPLPMAPAAPPAMPMPMGPPPMGGGMPMPPPGMGGGMPPLPRKSGGRVARSYRDMTAGAGSGEGRLQKTEIAKAKS